MKKLLIFTLLAFVAVLSCKKENFEHFTPSTGGFEHKNVTASFSGLIVGPDEKGLQGVSVTNGVNTTITDENGLFFFKNILVANTKAYFTAQKNGYFHGSRTLLVQENSDNRIYIKMLSSASVGSFTNASGGTIHLTQGAKITFDPNDVADANGNTYSGQVNVAAKKIDPTTEDGKFEMPGDLRGIGTDGNNKILSSYGMLAIELTDNNGNLLQVAPNQTVTISCDIPSSVQANAPQSIPLWYFDEASGDWKEEGDATLSGNTYTGEVSHFTYWNYDDNKPSVLFMAKFVDTDGNPIVGAWIHVGETGFGWGGHGQTNNNGFVIGEIAANSSLKLFYMAYSCSQNVNIYVMDITTTNVDLDMGTITLDQSLIQENNYQISGKLVDCTSNPIGNGYINLESELWYQTASATTQDDGSFSISTMTCSSATNQTVIITGYDYENLVQSAPQNIILSTPTINIGNLNACDIAIDEFFFIDFSNNLGWDTTITYYQPNIEFNIFSDSMGNDQVNIYGTSNDMYCILTSNAASAIGTTTGTMTYEGLIGFNQFSCIIDITSYPANPGELIVGTFASDTLASPINGSFYIELQ